MQKLLEEIEKNKDKVDECHKHAKAYIDADKVCMNADFRLFCTEIRVIFEYHVTECSHPGL